MREFRLGCLRLGLCLYSFRLSLLCSLCLLPGLFLGDSDLTLLPDVNDYDDDYEWSGYNYENDGSYVPDNDLETADIPRSKTFWEM